METKVKIFKLRNITEKNIVYKDPVKLKDKIVVPISYLDNNVTVPLFIQIPTLHLRDVDENGLVLSLNEQVATSLKSLDNKVIADIKGIIQKAKKLHDGKLLGKKFIYNAAVHMIEDDNGTIDKTFPDGVLKLPTPLKVFLDTHEPLKDPNLRDFIGVNVTSIVEVNSVVIKESTVSIYLKTHQLKITYPILEKYNLDDYSFLDEEDDPPKNMLFKLLNSSNENSESDNLEDPDEAQLKNYFIRNK
ncbi:MAG: hypothetical protein Hyperionvirus25_29 [Hyperionvirus sp.]|uniref:Uncharacterized protein n=1 Tax=Hyperionvirus sp. TaxID=2487770 RepID=A0A3G5AEX9_9VIRU|nr:MAG: hypothetical protein Hyperionvirus25_29 [Hyperionvirus sp.]